MNLLSRRIADRIRRSGPLPFSSFMAMALYDSEGGYYTSGAARTGRSGDFFTSVSTGPAFGELLAGQFLETWEALGRPRRFTIIEAGAGNGQFAFDVLTYLQNAHSDFFSTIIYQIDEPSEFLTEQQRRTLAPFAEKLLHSAEPVECGVFFANELLDAIPFRRVRFDAAAPAWHELYVNLTKDETAFAWMEREPEDRVLRKRLAWLGTDFPDGYTTEIAPAVSSHIRLAAALLKHGRLFFLDYGYSAVDYYAPHRITGTLRCYRAHTAGENPFEHLGETDITAHVDFSLAAAAAVSSGLEVEGFMDQARFLTGAAQHRLEKMNGQRPDVSAQRWLRQFQTLTHPSHMGMNFQALILNRGLPDPAPPLSGLAFARPSAIAELLKEEFSPSSLR